jgi:hypothetical protein
MGTQGSGAQVRPLGKPDPAAEAVVDHVYAWCKAQSKGHEPYSPFVADTVGMVFEAIKIHERAKGGVR